MLIKLRKDNADRWCFVEKHGVYNYKGDCNVTHVFDLFSEPLIFKGGFFQDLDAIKDIGVERYLKAKKPFYSKLDDNSCVVEIKVKYKGVEKELDSYSVALLKPLTTNKDKLIVQKIGSNERKLPEEYLELFKNCKDDRQLFLEGRKGVLESL